MGEVIGALLDYFAVSVPSGEEGWKLVLIWVGALVLTLAVGLFLVFG